MNDTVETASPAPAPTPVRKCEIGKVLGTTLHELLKSQPNHKHIRAQCLNVLRQEIPPNLVDYDQIKDWVEFNIDPPKAPKTTSGITINAEYSYTEEGTCRYFVRRSGGGEIGITGTRMEELAESCSSVDELLGEVKDDLITNNEIETEPGDYEYEEHEEGGSTNRELHYNRHALRLMVVEWMEANRADLLESWNEE